MVGGSSSSGGPAPGTWQRERMEGKETEMRREHRRGLLGEIPWDRNEQGIKPGLPSKIPHASAIRTSPHTVSPASIPDTDKRQYGSLGFWHAGSWQTPSRPQRSRQVSIH